MGFFYEKCKSIYFFFSPLARKQAKIEHMVVESINNQKNNNELIVSLSNSIIRINENIKEINYKLDSGLTQIFDIDRVLNDNSLLLEEMKKMLILENSTISELGKEFYRDINEYLNKTDRKRKFYFFQEFLEGKPFVTTVFDDEMIKYEPELLSQIIHVPDRFIDIENHILNSNSALYTELTSDYRKKQHLWRYCIRYGEIIELAYVREEYEAYFYRRFLNNGVFSVHIDESPIEYTAEGKKTIIRQAQSLEHYLRMACVFENVEVLEKKIFDYIDWIMDSYYFDEKCLNGMAWDCVPKNIFIREGNYYYFDNEGYYNRPIEKEMVLSIQCQNLRNILGVTLEARNKLWEKLLDRYDLHFNDYDIEEYINIQDMYVKAIISPEGMINQPDYHKYFLLN